jgi:hypothetical protein
MVFREKYRQAWQTYKENREIENMKFKTMITSRETGPAHKGFQNLFYSLSCLMGFMNVCFIF